MPTINATTSSFTIIPSSDAVSQAGEQNKSEISTEFMVTSTTVENEAKDSLSATEQEIVQHSSTIIPCIDHGDQVRGPQPIIAVIPPPETAMASSSSSTTTTNIPKLNTNAGKYQIITQNMWYRK